MKEIPIIFNYTNLSSFLEDYYQYLLSKNPAYSHRAWCKKLGLKHNATILNIIKGTKVPTAQICSKLISYFSFSEKEEEYFERLAILDRYSDNPTITALLKKDIQYQQHICKENSETKFNYNKKVQTPWLLSLKTFINSNKPTYDINQIYKTFIWPINKNELEEVLRTLIKNGEIIITEQNTLDTNSSYYIDPNKKSSDEYYTLCKSQIKETYDNLDDIMKHPSSIFFTCSFAINEKDRETIGQQVRLFLNEFYVKADTIPTGETTYQMQFQLYPVIDYRREEQRRKQE